MSQNAEHVLDHFELFRGPEYKEMLANKKKNFEDPVAAAEVERVREWTKTPEYREKNFGRQALTVNPARFWNEGFDWKSRMNSEWRSSTGREAGHTLAAFK
jgi:Domain of unknown function (DUF3364)